MKAIWHIFEDALSEDNISQIIQECEYYQPQEAQTGLGVDGKKNEQVRRSEVRWIDTQDKNSKFIVDIIDYYVAQANRMSFGVDITNTYDIQYTKYKAEQKGFYDWHFDTFWANTSSFDRKLSVTIQLSDGDEYEGGDFRFDPQYKPPDNKILRKKGTILVFPSVIRHMVEPVTKGERKSLVAWIEGPKWK